MHEASTQSTPNVVTFHVRRGWKGATENSQMTIYTPANSAACGYYFELDNVYLVYSSSINKEDWVNLCGRTMVANSDQARTDMEILDNLRNFSFGFRSMSY